MTLIHPQLDLSRFPQGLSTTGELSDFPPRVLRNVLKLDDVRVELGRNSQ